MKLLLFCFYKNSHIINAAPQILILTIHVKIHQTKLYNVCDNMIQFSGSTEVSDAEPEIGRFNSLDPTSKHGWKW